MMILKRVAAVVTITMLCGVHAHAVDPPRRLPVIPNQNPKELSYSYAVVTPKAHERTANVFRRNLNKMVFASELALYDARSLELLPDVVFLINDGSQEADSLALKARSNGADVFNCLTTNPDAEVAYHWFKNHYYSGLRPQYSTIFTAGDKGYHSFRIPSVTTTKDGTIVAISEARAFHRDQAENDIVSRRSMDGGFTWDEMTVVAEDGKNSLNNPTLIYLEKENRIVLTYQSYPQSMVEGMAKTQDDVYMRCYIIQSDDNGTTWSTPREITDELCPEGIQQFCTGPGVGIELTTGEHAGRLIIPCNAVMPHWFNYLVYSDDRGQSWKVLSGNSAYGTNESQVVEIDHNKLLVCARSHRNVRDTSFLAPKGWNPWAFDKVTRHRALLPVTIGDSTSQWATTQIIEDIPDPMCQGSIIRLGDVGSKDMILLVSNPASNYTWLEERLYERTPPMRVNGSVAYSDDGGKTWIKPKRIYGDRFTEYQYSVLTSLGSGKIGCIFEANADIKFAVFDTKWLTQ